MAFQIRNALFFISFFFLAVPALQLQAKETSCSGQPKAGLDFLRPSKELSREIVEKAKPSVLLCIVKTQGEKENIGRVMVNTEDETGTLYCEYSIQGVMAHEYIHFNWVDAGYYELLGFLESHAQRVNQMGHQVYFAMRGVGSSPDAVCASVDYKHGSMKFGHEYSKDGHSLCDGEDPKKEGPVYYHTYRRLICCGLEETGTAEAGNGNTVQSSQFAGEVGDEPSYCKGAVTFFPPCHQCSDGGCSAFRCSLFTTWDHCPPHSSFCGWEECVGGFCNDRRWCEQNK